MAMSSLIASIITACIAGTTTTVLTDNPKAGFFASLCAGAGGMVVYTFLYYGILSIIQSRQEYQQEKLKVAKPELLTVKVEDVTNENDEATPLLVSAAPATYQTEKPNPYPLYTAKDDSIGIVEIDSEEEKELERDRAPRTEKEFITNG